MNEELKAELENRRVRIIMSGKHYDGEVLSIRDGWLKLEAIDKKAGFFAKTGVGGMEPVIYLAVDKISLIHPYLKKEEA